MMQNGANPSEELAMTVIPMHTLPDLDQGFLHELARQGLIATPYNRLSEQSGSDLPTQRLKGLKIS